MPQIQKHVVIPGGCQWEESGERKSMECVDCYGRGVCEHEALAKFLEMQKEGEK